MYVRSRNHFCRGNAEKRYLLIVGIDVAVNNIKVLSFDVEMQQRVSFASLWSYKIFHRPTDVNIDKY